MGGTGDGARVADNLADNAVGEERGRLAARAYHTTRIDIEDVLRHNWLEFWYQPKIDLQRRTVIGAEALARIRHPELGVLLPKNFLTLLSEDGMAHLTERAVVTALADWHAFDAAGFNLHLSVNVPAKTLQQTPIAKLVIQNRPEAKHWPGLIVDAPEEEIVHDLDLAQKLAMELRISHTRSPSMTSAFTMKRSRGCANLPSPSSRSTTASSRTARWMREIPLSVRLRSILHTGSGSLPLRKASKATRISRRCSSWAAIKAKAC
jgi:hypothetical protein